MKKDDLTQAEAKRLWGYNPETGILTWKRRDDIASWENKNGNAVFNGKYAGNEITTIGSRGYIIVGFMMNKKFKLFTAHRLIHLIMTGSFPEHEVDHINGDCTDNRWSNLRACTSGENSRNMRLTSRNKTGCCGVWRRPSGRYAAEICHNRKRIRLGTYKDFDKAVAVRKMAEIIYGFHPNHGKAL